MGKTIDSVPADAMNALVQYHWPGNIRGLQNIIERAVIVTQGSVLKVGLGELESAPKTPDSERRDERNSMRKVLEETEREQIVRALEQTG
jgi:formate hydrogenlyase transcriptional activator